MASVTGSRSLRKVSSGKRVFDFFQERLGGWIASSQGTEADGFPIQVDHGTNQTVQPIPIDGKGMSEHVDTALVVGTSQIDDRSRGMFLQVKTPTFWKGTPSRRRLGTGRATLPGSDNVLGGTAGQPAKRMMFEPRPDLRLPETVEAFDGRLKTGLVGRRKYRNDPQAQAQSRHASHGIGMLSRSLKTIVVVELSIAGKSQCSPVFHQMLDHALGTDRPRRPGHRQSAMQRNSRQNGHIDRKSVV